MCGIVGYVASDASHSTNVIDILLDGLTILQNRGYDSVGLSTLNATGDLEIVKKASSYADTEVSRHHEPAHHQRSPSNSLERLKACSHLRSPFPVGVGHTRWATQGIPTERNAHPHTDRHRRVAVVHNGTITNHQHLRTSLEHNGVTFISDTDTEVIAQYIGWLLDDTSCSLVDAVRKTSLVLQGTWALVVMSTHTPRLLVTRHGSPLLVGLGSNDAECFVASEVSAFIKYTRKYVIVPEDDVFELPSIPSEWHDMCEMADPEEILLTPDPYTHWTLKEIMEQPQAVLRALQDRVGTLLDEQEQSMITALSTVTHVLLTACGTSFYAACYGKHVFQYLQCFDVVITEDASELSLSHLPRCGKTAVVALSQSGETKDTHRAVLLTRRLPKPCPTIAIVNQLGSLLSRSCAFTVPLRAGREHAVASTKAFTSQVVCLTVLGLQCAAQRSTTCPQRQRAVEAALVQLPATLERTLTHVSSACHTISAELMDCQHLFLLGKGCGEAVAKEGALKIKELSYIHAEGFGGGALKHGPFAMLTSKTPVLLIILHDEHYKRMIVAAEEILSRGAPVYVITDDACGELPTGISGTIQVPSNGIFTPLLAMLPLQLLAYNISVLKHLHPDTPRNLAKAVTVD